MTPLSQALFGIEWFEQLKLSSCSILWYHVQIAQWPYFLSQCIKCDNIIESSFHGDFFSTFEWLQRWLACLVVSKSRLAASTPILSGDIELFGNDFFVAAVTSFEMSLWSLDGAWLSLLGCLPSESTLQGIDIGSFRILISWSLQKNSRYSSLLRDLKGISIDGAPAPA